QQHSSECVPPRSLLVVNDMADQKLTGSIRGSIGVCEFECLENGVARQWLGHAAQTSAEDSLALRGEVPKGVEDLGWFRKAALDQVGNGHCLTSIRSAGASSPPNGKLAYVFPQRGVADSGDPEAEYSVSQLL